MEKSSNLKFWIWSLRVSREFFFSFDYCLSFVLCYLYTREGHVKTYACKSALSIHRWKIFSHPHFFIPSQHGWKNEAGKKKLFALSVTGRLFREKTLHESVISSRIKTTKKLEGLGSRFPRARRLQTVASLQNNSNENILV